MADGPAGFTRGSTCPALLRIPPGFASLRVRAFHPLRGGFPAASARSALASMAVLQPRPGRNRGGLGCSPFARHYWGNHILFSLPAGTKMFQFPAFASSHREDGSPSDCRVAPFRNLRIRGRLRLPGAFRSLPRLSSPSRATGIRRAPFLAFACALGILSPGAHALELLSYSFSSLLFQHVNDRTPVPPRGGAKNV